MSLKHRFISAVTAGAAIIAFSSFVGAQETKTETQTQPTGKQERVERRGKRDGLGERDGKRMGPRRKRGGMMRGLRGLNLSEEQKAQFKTIMGSRRGSEVNREEMRAIMTAKRDGTITPEQTQKLEAFKTTMKENRRRTHEQILAILTPEQRAQLETRKQEMKRRMEERRQNREPKQPPTEQKDNE
jgi:Spy/CpxP family protein refolding chaperone